MKDKNVIKEFEEEYGISLVPEEPLQQQAQEPQQKQVNENLFEKLSRLSNREIFCDLDITEYKRLKKIDAVIRITLVILLITVIITICNYGGGGVTKCNLVTAPGGTEPAHLGYKFTDELVAEIKSGDIDLYEVYIVEDNSTENEAALQGIRIENKYGFPIKNICISDVNYVKYSDEYINKMFSKEYIKEHDDNWGYWEYTLDYQS